MTGDASSPFPEELNGRLITSLAALHFAAAGEKVASLLAGRRYPSKGGRVAEL